MLCQNCARGLSAFFKSSIVSRTVQNVAVKRTFTSLTPLRPTIFPSAFRTSTPVNASAAVVGEGVQVDLALAPFKMSTHPAMEAMQVRCAPRNTFNPSHFVRKRRHGFLARLRTQSSYDSSIITMHLSRLLALSALGVSVGLGLDLSRRTTAMIDVLWNVSNIRMENTLRSSGAVFSFDITDSAPAPQGFNTSCSYWNATSIYLPDNLPDSVNCTDLSVSFSIGMYNQKYFLFVHHEYGYCPNSQHKGYSCQDYGQWYFSADDVEGQVLDVRNDNGHYSHFTRDYIMMNPDRDIEVQVPFQY
ncbi:hypothetical protein G7Y89_g8247 [Cudoniella acicularis]|uniref:Uncharacterized protein n=1 Tax=Cudoniella acicularis TaxID=354080 RepID=A0A8H4RKL2_9HELO|nr:hypothetical protein G7Y89_g8247 [Cudoniella acicularis]